MRIALVGGTGALGTGLAARWSEKHEVLLGSRSYDRAKAASDKVKSTMAELKIKASVDPYENYHAIAKAEVVVLCLAYEQAMAAVRQLVAGFSNQVVISPLSPMMPINDLFQYIRPREGSAAMQLRQLLPGQTELVSAFQGLPASKLLDVRRTINFDVPVFTDSGSARKKTFDLIRDIKYLRPLNGGPLELAHLGEMMGPLWRSIASLNKMRDPSFKFLE